MGDMSGILGMNVTRDRKKGAITFREKDFADDVVQRYGMEGYNHSYTPRVVPEMSLNQPEKTLLNEEKKRGYQAITGDAMYLTHVIRYGILYAVNQLARAMSKPAKTHTGVTKYLLRYLIGSIDFSITYKQGRFRLAAFSAAKWGKYPDNGRST